MPLMILESILTSIFYMDLKPNILSSLNLLSAMWLSSKTPIFPSQIRDLRRETIGGFSRGSLVIQAFDEMDEIEVVFKNENLIARRGGKTIGKAFLQAETHACCPNYPYLVKQWL